MHYRRIFQPGGTYFFTVVTKNRCPIFQEPTAINLFKKAVYFTKSRYDFCMNAFVILPDHLHCIWTLPLYDHNFSKRWMLIKSYFTRHFYLKSDPWQKRFWEHLIRNQQDLHQHIDYIHFNPVKHGLVSAPRHWTHSSFHEFVRRGWLDLHWGKNKIITFDDRIGSE